MLIYRLDSSYCWFDVHSSPLKAERVTSAMVTNDQNAHSVVYYTKQKMVWKSIEIHTSQVALANAESFRRVSRFLEEGSQLAVELFR
jgi:hypothetical protein